MSKTNHTDNTATPTQVAERTRSIAYLVSQYPMLSMIFIIREVVQLRELGFRIDVASINAPDRSGEGLTAIEAAEAERTYCLKRHGVVGVARAHLLAAFGRPVGYLRGMQLVFRLGGV